jgi:predicted unusual protein kinase regulating ubiquinone biosynthesis (AarF/ABC1/UbiB family)
MSSRGDVMPAPWVEELSKLQDAMPARAGSAVRRDLAREFGRPLDAIFARFEDTALASASIAQVHRATLLSGKQVRPPEL